MTGNTKGGRESQADSVIVFSNSQGITARGTLVSLNRTLVIFEVYNPYSIVQLSEVLKEVQISRRQNVIYTGRAMVSNLVSTGLMLIVSAALVDPWNELEGTGTKLGIREETNRFLADWEDGANLEPGFQFAVNRLKNFLSELNRWIEGTELTLGAQNGRQRQPLSHDLVDEVHDCIAGRIEELVAGFEHEYARIGSERHGIHKYYAQRELHPLVMVSPFVHRCFSKPLGYAGDYEMLNMMLRNPNDGPNSYSWLVNRHILTTAPAIAYSNRITMLVEYIRQENMRVRRVHGRPLRALTIGCGPVNEIQRFMREDALSSGCVFQLMDFNQPTIDFARERVEATSRETGRHIDASYVNKSIHELLQDIRGKEGGPEEQFDMIYCAGLFDYFSNRICNGLMSLFYQRVTPGGMLIVTNVAHSRPIVGYMEMLMEWYLIYRSGKDMLRLNPDLGTQCVRADSTTINQFLLIRKPG